MFKVLANRSGIHDCLVSHGLMQLRLWLPPGWDMVRILRIVCAIRFCHPMALIATMQLDATAMSPGSTHGSVQGCGLDCPQPEVERQRADRQPHQAPGGGASLDHHRIRHVAERGAIRLPTVQRTTNICRFGRIGHFHANPLHRAD